MMTSIPLVAQVKSLVPSPEATVHAERGLIMSTEEEERLREELEVPADSVLVTRFACSLKSEKSTFLGFAFLFNDALRFRSDSQARMVVIAIPLLEITELETKMTSLIIPNMIKIKTKPKEYLFVMDSQERDPIFQILLLHWKRAIITRGHGAELLHTLDGINNRLAAIKKTMEKKNLRMTADSSQLNQLLTRTLHLPSTEALVDHYACSLDQGRLGVPAGRLYITQNYLAFHENIRFVSKARQEIIELSKVTSLHKRNSTSLELPNSIQVFTHSSKFLFSMFLNRNEVYELIRDCWNAVRRRKGLLFEEEDDDSDDLLDDKDDSEEQSDEEDTKEEISFLEMQNLRDESPEDVTLDMYGFEVPSQLVSVYNEEMDLFARSLRKQRRAWRYFQSANDLDMHIQHHTPQLMKLIRKGIPFEMRGQLWYQFSGAKEKMEASSMPYTELLKKKSHYSADIGKDLSRTFPYHPVYQQDINLAKLERVLVAFAIRNPAIGYCQSMNFITALLLLFMPEEQAFWVLVTIVEDRLQDYFSESMVGTIVDQEVLEEQLRQKFPVIMEHVEMYGLPLAVVSTRWFMCLFIGALPTETVLRIWDLFFFHGSPVIITMALSLIKLYENDLLNITNTENFMTYSTTFGMNCFNVEVLFRIAFNVVGLMDNRHLNSIRARYWEQTRDYLEDENKKRDIYLLERSTHYSAQELEEWYNNWHEFKNMGSKVPDYSSRDSLGVDLEVFSESVQRLAPEWGREEVKDLLEKLFHFLDKNQDELLDFKEMVGGISQISKGTRDEKAALFFRMYSNKGLKLQQEDMREALRAFCRIYHPGKDHSEEIEEICQQEPNGVDSERFQEIVISQLTFPQVQPSAWLSNTERIRSSIGIIGTSRGRIISVESKPRQLSRSPTPTPALLHRRSISQSQPNVVTHDPIDLPNDTSRHAATPNGDTPM